jgi:hypothetical protein
VSIALDAEYERAGDLRVGRSCGAAVGAAVRSLGSEAKRLADVPVAEDWRE